MKKERKKIQPSERECLYCHGKFMSAANSAKYCCKEHRNLHVFELRYADGVEDVDYVVCRWCGMRVGRIYGKHMQKYHKGRTEAEYRAEFPDAPVCSSKDRAETSKSSGLFMREEKYRIKYSEAIRGANNPNHSSKSDPEKRKSISPYSIEFYRKRYPNLPEEELERMRKEKMDSAIAKRVLPTQVLYWTSRGFTEEEAKIKISAHQRTFTKEKLITKYGEEEGIRRWTERQQKWREKVYNQNTCISTGCSAAALDLFEHLVMKMGRHDNTFLYDRSEKIIHDGIRPYKYDFTVVETKKIIEFNGTYWHCDPRKYEPDYYNRGKQMMAQEIWDVDKYKKELAERHGYSVLYIWEHDFDEDPLGAINKCIQFLNA